MTHSEAHKAIRAIKEAELLKDKLDELVTHYMFINYPERKVTKISYRMETGADWADVEYQVHDYGMEPNTYKDDLPLDWLDFDED
jgi:hypothetical protein